MRGETMGRIRNLKHKLWITVIILVSVAILYASPISCVFLELTGIKCPGCGMTRALLAALRLDFNVAFLHHAMFWSVPLLYVAFLFDGRLFCKKWMNTLFYIVMLIGFLANWIWNK